PGSLYNCGSDQFESIAQTVYPSVSQSITIGQTKEKIYDVTDPSRFVEKITDYTYSPQHLQLTQIKVTTSKGDQSVADELLINRKYPFDYTFSGNPSGTEAQGIKNLQDL